MLGFLCLSFFCAFWLRLNASEVWAPQTTVHHLRILEGVQCQATRFILSCSYKVSKRSDYKSQLKSLKLLPLCYWHEFRDICFFYKCMHKYCNIIVNEYTNIITGRTRNAINSNLGPTRVRTSLFRDSFFNRILPLWNNISLDIRQTTALSTFKDRLFLNSNKYTLKLININYFIS